MIVEPGSISHERLHRAQPRGVEAQSDGERYTFEGPTLIDTLETERMMELEFVEG